MFIRKVYSNNRRLLSINNVRILNKRYRLKSSLITTNNMKLSSSSNLIKLTGLGLGFILISIPIQYYNNINNNNNNNHNNRNRKRNYNNLNNNDIKIDKQKVWENAPFYILPGKKFDVYAPISYTMKQRLQNEKPLPDPNKIVIFKLQESQIAKLPLIYAMSWLGGIAFGAFMSIFSISGPAIGAQGGKNNIYYIKS